MSRLTKQIHTVDSLDRLIDRVPDHAGVVHWRCRQTILRHRGVRHKPARVFFMVFNGLVEAPVSVRRRCADPDCVMPGHLYAGRTQSHCKRGHALEGANLRETPDGRQCRACQKARAKRWWADHQNYERRPRKPFTRRTCRRGHVFTDESTVLKKNGYRECKTCRDARRKVRGG